MPMKLAAAVVAASACLVAAAAPALAAPGGNGHANQHSIDAHLRHELKMAAKERGAVLDTGTPGSGGLLGVPEGSYPVTSSTYSMGKFGDSPEVLASCSSGYYVDYTSTFDNEIGGWLYHLNIGVHSSSSFVGTASGYPQSWDQIGSDSDGVPLYQGFYMKLSNNNLFYSNSGSFSWTCDPLPAP